MPVHTNIDQLPSFKNAVITVGTFDGVHQGHVQILKQIVNEAKEINGTPVVITFYPHPRHVIEHNTAPLYVLNTPEEKYALLQSHGISDIVVVPFDKNFSEQTASEYISSFLVNRFHPHTIIIGYDHKFGVNREGNFKLLQEYSSIYNYRIKEIPEHVLKSIVISSTKIREALHVGSIDTADEFLGYPYSLTGIVVEGKKLGRTLGYPTANLQVQDKDKLIPSLGIYAVSVQLENSKQPFIGMMSIGMNPTVNGKDRTIEINIFDFDQNIYGLKLQVSIFKRLRGEVKFDDLEALKIQMAEDKKDTLAVLHNCINRPSS